MILSMTGFGKADVTLSQKSYRVIVKSVNSKISDINVKLPSIYREKENEVRTLLQNELQRGKIDLYIISDYLNHGSLVSVNPTVFHSHLKDLKSISVGLQISEDTLFSLVMKMPDVFSQEKEDPDEQDWKEMEKGIRVAINQLNEFRRQEGSVLEKDLLMRVTDIIRLLEDIKQWEGERIEGIKSRIENQLSQLQPGEKFSSDRFEQELIYYFEKLDITEEKVRLIAHCNLFVDTINENESQGRKLGFISQEMGREINTIGSKANHAKIQQTVVEMKDELEKIKEQLFNIL